MTAEHGAQIHLAGDLHELFGLALIFHARQVDDDRVALSQDFRLGDTEGVDPLANLLDSKVEITRTALLEQRLSQLWADIPVSAGEKIPR